MAHKDGQLDERILELVAIQASFAVACPFCVDMNSFQYEVYRIGPSRARVAGARAHGRCQYLLGTGEAGHTICKAGFSNAFTVPWPIHPSTEAAFLRTRDGHSGQYSCTSELLGAPDPGARGSSSRLFGPMSLRDQKYRKVRAIKNFLFLLKLSVTFRCPTSNSLETTCMVIQPSRRLQKTAWEPDRAVPATNNQSLYKLNEHSRSGMKRKHSVASTKRQYKTAVRKRHDWLTFWPDWPGYTGAGGSICVSFQPGRRADSGSATDRLSTEQLFPDRYC